jgi:CrcB protein
VLSQALLVAAGGFCGGLARFLVSGLVASRIGEVFPWGTLVVNVSGALLIGLLAGLADRGVLAAPPAHALLVTGFCGGYTTVSSFALQSLALALDGERRAALANVLASTLLCVAAVGLGFWAAAGR